MKLVQSILILPRPPRARGEVSHLMIGLRLPGEVRDGAVSGMGRMAVEDMVGRFLPACPVQIAIPWLSASGARGSGASRSEQSPPRFHNGDLHLYSWNQTI